MVGRGTAPISAFATFAFLFPFFFVPLDIADIARTTEERPRKTRQVSDQRAFGNSGPAFHAVTLLPALCHFSWFVFACSPHTLALNKSLTCQLSKYKLGSANLRYYVQPLMLQTKAVRFLTIRFPPQTGYYSHFKENCSQLRYSSNTTSDSGPRSRCCSWTLIS